MEGVGHGESVLSFSAKKGNCVLALPLLARITGALGITIL